MGEKEILGYIEDFDVSIYKKCKLIIEICCVIY